MKQRVFVVMPYGKRKVLAKQRDPGGTTSEADVSVNFDHIYNSLLAPAITLSGCTPFRADEETAAGDIRTDMFFELVASDVVVADVSMLNANVFYELGIRHAATPRGAIMVHGRWNDRPFDIYPDRLFEYDKSLFADPETPPSGPKLEAAVQKLAETFRKAIAAPPDPPGSPVYSHLVGMKPTDWTKITNARPKYFKGVLEDWQAILSRAKQRQAPGDILTLAEEAPTTFLAEKFHYDAAMSLIDLRRYARAIEVLDQLLEETPPDSPVHINAQCQRALAMNRLALTRQDAARRVLAAEARADLETLRIRHATNPEVCGILGRVYKDEWRSRWEKEPEIQDRRRVAAENASDAVQAIDCYAVAFRADLRSYYTGINVVSLASLLKHLSDHGEQVLAEPSCASCLVDVAGAVRLGASNDVARLIAANRLNDPDLVWARASLAELELMTGDASDALGPARVYSQALTAGPALFKVDSMLSQLTLLDQLGFRPDATTAVIKVLSPRLKPPTPPPERVAAASGHMIDAPDRATPRFPREREDAVRAAIAATITQWGLGPKDLAICGGARGADILFAEECLKRAVTVRLYIPLPEDQFRQKSLYLGSDDSWSKRYDTLKEKCEVAFLHDRLGPAPEDADVFERNNHWIINTVRSESDSPAYALVVWDRKPTGDGRGGTSHFVKEIGSLGRTPDVIDPLKC